MSSKLRFVMHPNDEIEFAAEILRDARVWLIDGPRWKAPTPETLRSIEAVKGDYCIIWSPIDRSTLGARYVESCGDWYCDSEQVTIQFLRSRLFDSALTEGRIALNTSDLTETEAAGVEQRYKSLSRFLKKHYQNRVVRWWNPTLPVNSAASSRSANPAEPDAQLWVGPYARRWLCENRAHRVKQAMNSQVEAEPAE